MRMNYLPVAVFAAFSLSAVAQSRVCIGGNLDNLSPAQITACQAKSAGVQAAAKRLGVRNDWHIIVVCDDASWSDYASFAGKSVAAVMETDQQTDADTRTTFVRGSRLVVERRRAVDQLLAAAMEQLPAESRPTGGKPRLQPTGDQLATVHTQDSTGQAR